MVIFSRFYCEFPLFIQPFLVFLPLRSGTSYQMILEGGTNEVKSKIRLLKFG